MQNSAMNLFKTLLTISSLTFITRILGFVRDMLIARVFGAGIITDAFFVAFKIPNLLRRISAEGAFSQAFVPVLAEYKSQKTQTDLRYFADCIFTYLSLFLLVIVVLGMLCAPWVIDLTAPGFRENQSQFQLTVELLRITFPYILFISLTSFASGILNTYRQFAIPALTPALLNISFIAVLLFVSPYFNNPPHVLAWAVFVGGILQLLFQLPFLGRLGLLPRFRWDSRNRGVWQVLRLMSPAILGVSVAQISLLINTIFASFLREGSVSWLYYADRLMELPVGVLGVALGTILLPSLSKSFAEQNKEAYQMQLDWGIKMTLLFTLPIMLALFFLATPITVSLFFYGKFTLEDVRMTAVTLQAYSIGLLGLILVKVFAPAFYAQQNVKTPVKIAIFCLFITQAMNVLFIPYLQHTGLALSISLASYANAGILFWQIQKQGMYKIEAEWGSWLLKLGVALSLMGMVLYFLSTHFEAYVQYTLLQRWGMLILHGSVALGVYFGALYLAGMRSRDLVKII